MVFSLFAGYVSTKPNDMTVSFSKNDASVVDKPNWPINFNGKSDCKMDLLEIANNVRLQPGQRNGVSKKGRMVRVQIVDSKTTGVVWNLLIFGANKNQKRNKARRVT